MSGWLIDWGTGTEQVEWAEVGYIGVDDQWVAVRRFTRQREGSRRGSVVEDPLRSAEAHVHLPQRRRTVMAVIPTIRFEVACDACARLSGLFGASPQDAINAAVTDFDWTFSVIGDWYAAADAVAQDPALRAKDVSRLLCPACGGEAGE